VKASSLKAWFTRKRILTALGVGVMAVVAVAAFEEVRIRKELERALAERRNNLAVQAVEIAKHRDTQRANEPVAAAPAPVKSGGTPATSPVQSDRAAALQPAGPPYWTDFRGPRRDGHYRERPILTDWPPSGLRPLWKQPIGSGHGSFAVAGGRAFTLEQRGNEEVAAAYDVVTGRESWTNRWQAMFSDYYGGEGPNATPAWHDGTVYVLGATGELRALDAATGRLRWRTNILDDAGGANLQWGMSASPLVAGETVIVLPGGDNGRSIVAYHRDSGKRVWSALDDRASYSSPMIVKLAGVDQLLVFSASRLVSLSLDDKRVLWEFPWATDGGINPSQPSVIGENRVFLSTGYGMGAVLIEVAATGTGFTVREVWRTNRMKNQFTSSVHHDGFIYGLDEAILACLDAATGELKWKGGRYGYGQVILASGHLVVTTDEGDLALVRATPERHVEVARFSALSGRTWNHPAIADGYLLIRNGREMAAFDLRLPR
jgi:outer membrane protein assembly factor BamB